MNKTTKIVLMFILIGVFLCNNLSYAFNKPSLRSPLTCNDKAFKNRFNGAGESKHDISLREEIVRQLIAKLSSISDKERPKVSFDISLVDYVFYWIEKFFEKDQPALAENIIVEAIKNRLPGIATGDLRGWIEQCFEGAWPDSVRDIIVEAIKNRLPGVTTGDLRGWIKKCFEENNPYLAGNIIVEAIKNKLPGVTIDDLQDSIQQCFEEGDPHLAENIIVKAMKNTEFSKKTIEIVDLLKNPATSIKGNFDLNISATSYALEHDQVEDLITVLPSIKENEHMLGMLQIFIRKEGQDIILGEIFKDKGLKSFVKLYDGIYPHIYKDLLPKEVDFKDKRTKIVLSQITRFYISKNARSDLNFQAIYDKYSDDYKKGNIKPLPENIPPPRTIRVATRRSASLSHDVEPYYNNMIDSVKEALVLIKNEGPSYKKHLSMLIALIDGRVEYLRKQSEKDNLPPKAVENITKESDLLKQTKTILSSSDKNTFPILALSEENIQAINKLKNITPVIRTLLFSYALENNSSWQEDFRKYAKEQASLPVIAEFTQFIDSFIKPHLLDNMDPEARKALLKHVNTRIFKEEIDRLSQDKTEFTRKIKIIPARGWISEFIGYFSDECWTDTRNIIRDNPDTIPLVFVDEDTNELLGGTLLMPNSIEKENVLIDRGLSPRTEVTSGLNIESFVTQVTDYEEDIATSLGAGQILVLLRALEAGLGSNNPDIIQYYERELPGAKPVTLDKPNTFNGHNITKGRCVIFRKVTANEASSYRPSKALRKGL